MFGFFGIASELMFILQQFFLMFLFQLFHLSVDIFFVFHQSLKPIFFLRYQLLFILLFQGFSFQLMLSLQGYHGNHFEFFTQILQFQFDHFCLLILMVIFEINSFLIEINYEVVKVVQSNLCLILNLLSIQFSLISVFFAHDNINIKRL